MTVITESQAAPAGSDVPQPVAVTELADGVIVRLSGPIDVSSTAALRRALLSPRPARCRDVLVDAGNVETLDDDALAVLLAGAGWARDSGRRFAFTRVSPVVQQLVETLRLGDLLPGLPPLRESVPQSRAV